jgi:Bifunctional DNA primase/polymerase, N-terminal
MTDRHDAAVAYATRGWRVVRLEGKVPAVGRRWPEKATTNPEIIGRWWRARDWNVGVVVADSFLALDIDPRSGDDDVLHDLESELGALPHTPTYQTRGADGGWRILLQHPRVDLAHELEGIQIKHGHQVIAMPPSIHPDTGLQYAWEVELDEAPLAALPSGWHERLVVQSKRRALRTTSEDADVLSRIDAAVYIEAITGLVPDPRGYVRCPFHANGRERTPSLWADGNLWCCHGRCRPLPGQRKLGGGIYQFAALAWGFQLPLRDVQFLAVQDRLYEVMLAHFGSRATATP